MFSSAIRRLFRSRRTQQRRRRHSRLRTPRPGIANDIQTLEDRTLLASAVVSGTTLLVIDNLSQENLFSLSMANGGADLVLSDASNTFTAGSGVTAVPGNPNSVTVPLASLTAISFSTGGGDDVVTVDFESGGEVPVDVSFSGSTGDDQLVVFGNNTEIAVMTPDVGATGNGQVDIDTNADGTTDVTVNYSSITEVTLGHLQKATFTTAAGAADTVDVATRGPEYHRITGSTDGVPFESLTLLNVADLEVDTDTNDTGGGDGDVVTLSSEAEFGPGPIGGRVSESEPNDSTPFADELGVDRFGSGSILKFGDADTDVWKTTSPAAGHLVYAYVDTQSSTTGTNSVLEVLADDGTTLIGSDLSSGPSFTSVVAGATVRRAGDVFLRIHEDGDNESIVPYSLYQAVVDPADTAAESETNDSAAEADPVSAAIMTGDVADGSGDVDFYQVYAPAGSRLVVMMDDDPEDDGSLTDTELQIIDSDGTTVLARGDNFSGDAFNAAGAVTIPRSGTYYIRVGDGGLGSDSSYNFVARVVSPREPATQMLRNLIVRTDDDYKPLATAESSRVIVEDPFQVADDIRVGTQSISFSAPLSAGDLISLNAGRGSITEVARSESPLIVAARAALRAGGQIGTQPFSDRDIDLQVQSLAVVSTGSSISLSNSGRTAITSVDGVDGVSVASPNSFADITIVQHGDAPFEILEDVIGPGDITIAKHVPGTESLTINAEISATDAGNIRLISGAGVTFGQAVISTTGSGSVSVHAGAQFIEGTMEVTDGRWSDADIVSPSSPDEYQLASESGNISLHASGDIQVDRINADSDRVNAAGSVTIVADSDGDGAGRIRDSTGSEGHQITADAVAFRAGNGIGDAINPALDIDISAAAFAAETATGDISIHSFGDTTIGVVDGVEGVSIETGGPADEIVVAVSRDLVSGRFVVARPISNAGGGDITLYSTSTDAGDRLHVDGDVTASGGDIALFSGSGIVLSQNGPPVTVSTTGAGTIDVHAGRVFSVSGPPTLGSGDRSISQRNDYLLQTLAGDVTLTATHSISLDTVNGNTVVVTADSDQDGDGRIDDTKTSEDPNVIGQAAAFRAGEGIGRPLPGGDINLHVQRVAARTMTGDVGLTTGVTGTLTVGSVDGLDGVAVAAGTSGDDILILHTGSRTLELNRDVVNSGPGLITVAVNGPAGILDVQADVTGTGGNIRLLAEGILHFRDRDLDGRSPAVTTTRSGDLEILAGRRFQLGSAASGTGVGAIAADGTAGREYLVGTDEGNIFVHASSRIDVGNINADVDGAGARGAVYVHSTTSALIDVTGSEAGGQIVAESAVLRGSTGVGSGLTSPRDLNTDVDVLAVSTSSGDINVLNSGSLTIGSVPRTIFELSAIVPGGSGIIITDQEQDDSGDDHIVIAATDTIVVEATVDNRDEGTITVTYGDGHDFGDAPDRPDAPLTGGPYPTLAQHLGAAHTIWNGVMLGRIIDSEPDGQPTPRAQGDDTSRLNDDDGVVFTSPLRPGATVTVDVEASVAGFLNAWVDFNDDGDWQDAGEQIFDDHRLDDGVNALSFDVPAAAVVGTLHGRFRFDRSGGLGPEGFASGGEVEDYAVAIARSTSVVGRNPRNGRWQIARSTGASFVSEEVGQWAPSVNWEHVTTADVNGDGNDDIVGRDGSSGDWWVGLADGSGTFTNRNWGTWATFVNWVDVNMADVNGDGNADLVGRQQNNGKWWVALSNGADGFTNRPWGGFTPIPWLDVNIADVNGDGFDDIVARQQSNGNWWVARSNGVDGFTNQRWGHFTPIPWVDVNIADVNGDGNDDIVARQQSNGDWWVALSNGSDGFINQRWSRWAVIPWVDVNIADVNGDGYDDIAARQQSNGNWWVALSNGADGFTTRKWGHWSPSVTWVDVFFGDVDGDGNDDIIGREQSNGRWWVGRSNGDDSFDNEFWGEWDSAVAWQDVRLIHDLLTV